MVEFKKFKVSELFDYRRGKESAPKKVPKGDISLISETSSHNGFVRGASSTHVFPAKTITVSVNYAQTVFLQPKEFCASVNIIILVPKFDNVLDAALLYFVALLRANNGVYDYNYKISKDRLMNTVLLVPVTSTGDPDFAYMARRIDELEAQRIDELEAQRIDELSAYLKVSGLDNTVLTDEEKDALTKKVTWKKFRIGDLFHQVTLKRIKENFDKKKDTSTEKTTEFDLPLINAKLGNNGIMYYGRSKDWKSTDLGIDIIQNGAVATGMVYPQPDQVGRMWDAYIVKWNNQNDILNTKHILYLAGCIRQSIRGNYNYQRKATWTRVQGDNIFLPVTSTGSIDFAYMQHYITAIEKQSIKGVIAYKDKVIATTKKVVNGNV